MAGVNPARGIPTFGSGGGAMSKVRMGGRAPGPVRPEEFSAFGMTCLERAAAT